MISTDMYALAAWLMMIGVLGFLWALQEIDGSVVPRRFVDIVALLSILACVSSVAVGITAYRSCEAERSIYDTGVSCWRPSHYEVLNHGTDDL